MQLSLLYTWTIFVASVPQCGWCPTAGELADPEEAFAGLSAATPSYKEGGGEWWLMMTLPLLLAAIKACNIRHLAASVSSPTTLPVGWPVVVGSPTTTTPTTTSTSRRLAAGCWGGECSNGRTVLLLPPAPPLLRC
jgi:hypothetical protein